MEASEEEQMEPSEKKQVEPEICLNFENASFIKFLHERSNTLTLQNGMKVNIEIFKNSVEDFCNSPH